MSEKLFSHQSWRTFAFFLFLSFKLQKKNILIDYTKWKGIINKENDELLYNHAIINVSPVLLQCDRNKIPFVC